MGLVRDLSLVNDATAIPALREVVREALIRAMFVRDERALPKDVVRVLRRKADVVVKIKDEIEAREVVRVANGETSTVAMGRPADEFHYYRQKLGMGKDQPWGVCTKPSLLQTYDWIVPPQGGIMVELDALADVEVDGVNFAAKVGAGGRWKTLYDRAVDVGMLPSVFPSIPLDVAVGDGIVGDARFRSYRSSFSSAVYDVRGLAANGLRVNCGFEYVTNAATGYNLRELAVQFGAEFLVPTFLWIRLTARPPTVKNFTYTFDDAAKLSGALDRVTRSGRPYLWANLYDERGWTLVHGSNASGPFTLEVGVGGTDALVATRTKALEAAVAGFTAKGEAPIPWDGDAGAYTARSAKLHRLLYVGEVVAPAKDTGAISDRVRGLGESKGVRAGVFGNAMDNGQVYLSPYFDAAREPMRIYDLSRGVADLVRGFPDAAFDSRLAHLWNEEAQFQKRAAILLRLEAGLDMPNAIEPAATLEPEPVELFPGEQEPPKP
ncbi:MAG TPA: hypothetical protein VGR51_08540 [Thermoplasmata archaeon]|jgi:hypothetical protein|nr:hypothetical protein [Thermoplasmata archaeon]